VELADGRTVGVAEWGPGDGPPVVYCHGFPGSRLEPALAQSVSKVPEIGARVLALDRPGFGRSTAKKGRSFLDWPRDVAEAADRIGIGSFAMLGASGGCPFALACGLRLDDRVTRIGIVAGTGPLDAPGMEDTQLISGPSRYRPVRRLQWGLMAKAANTGRLDRLVDRSRGMMADVDRAAMERAEVRRWYRTVFSESLAQGSAAAVLEGELYRRPWGFEPAQVGIETHIWHGRADNWVPLSVARWLADQLPNARLTVWPQHGHFSWATGSEAADVMGVLVGLEGGGGLIPDLGESLDCGDDGEDQHHPQHRHQE
jgi:pimeloyl-ACP methyl ester carboxylesterase